MDAELGAEVGPGPRCLRERRTVELLAENSRWEYENLPYWSGEVDCCINAWMAAGGRHPGRVWFEVDAPAGEPSKASAANAADFPIPDMPVTNTAAGYVRLIRPSRVRCPSL